MKKILIINGPNLNLLGIREPEIYGKCTFAELEKLCLEHAIQLKVKINFRQTNHEGVIIDWIQEAIGKFDGIIINPAAYSHTSIAILDALKMFDGPKIEVHLSDISAREEFRHLSYTSLACNETIKGLGMQGYLLALEKISQLI